MFKGPMLGSFAFFATLFAGWAGLTLLVQEKDRAFLSERLEKKALASARGSSYLPTSQIRENVRKDIWFAEEATSRLHHRIDSHRSELTLRPIRSHFEAVETLEGISCFMQDKVYLEDGEEKQQARFLKAAGGLYRYSTQEFTAEGVELSLFRLPGHNLPATPVKEQEAFLRGLARRVSFTFGGKTPQFQAGEFKATLVRE